MHHHSLLTNADVFCPQERKGAFGRFQIDVVMRRRSENYVVKRFRRRANVIECTYTNLDSIAYYTPSLLLLGYKPVQHVTVLNTVGQL
jgi:hypothetical protein